MARFMALHHASPRPRGIPRDPGPGAWRRASPSPPQSASCGSEPPPPSAAGDPPAE